MQDSGAGHDLTEFVKILTLEYLQFFLYKYFRNFDMM
jgi:hypothetical protein